MNTFSIFTLDLTREEQRLLSSIATKDEDGRGYEIQREDAEKAFELIGKTFLEAFPRFIEYDGGIAVVESSVYMQYFDRGENEYIELEIPLEWCLEYLASKGKIDSFYFNEGDSFVMVMHEYEIEDSRPEKCPADYFIVDALDQCDARHMLYAYYVEQLAIQFKHQQLKAA